MMVSKAFGVSILALVSMVNSGCASEYGKHDELNVNKLHSALLASQDSLDQSNVTQLAPIGVLNTAVLLLDFEDKPLSCTASEVNGLMFDDTDSISAFYQEVSGDRLHVEGDVFGPFPIPYSSTECARWQDFSSVEEGVYAALPRFIDYAEVAWQQAAANGIELTDYDRVIYVVPDRQSGCVSPSMGVAPGPDLTQGHIWIIGDETETPHFGSSFCGVSSKFAHEFGHTLGMAHASTPGNGFSLGGNYGDTSDSMGGVRDRQYVTMNAPHRYEMGWLDPEDVVDVPSGGGTYVIALLESGLFDVPRVLRIPRPIQGDHVYVSYRVPTSFDATLDPSHHFKVQVHTWAPGQIPGNPTAFTTLEAELATGETFIDEGLEVGVHVLERGIYGARIFVATAQ